MLKYTEQKATIPVVTIDGPSGAGKGTISSTLAKSLGWHFLDSGAIYRCLAYSVHQNSVSTTDVQAITTIANQLNPRFICSTNKNYGIWLNDEDVTEAIREEIIGQVASKISGYSEVRTALLECQRNFVQAPGLIADGRDMGTVIFPNAQLKIFLDASPEERAKRRHLQLHTSGQTSNLQQITEELRVRDTRDRNREVAPLRAACDAILIDTTDLNIAEVVAKVLELVTARDLVTTLQA